MRAIRIILSISIFMCAVLYTVPVMAVCGGGLKWRGDLYAQKTDSTSASRGSKAARARDNDYRMGKSMEIFNNIFRDISLFYVDSVSSESMLENAAAGMLSKLDPYTQYLPESEMADFEMMTSGKYGGIGSMIRQRGAWVEIAEPYRGSPADLAGLKAGDRIVSIDGESMRGAAVGVVSGKLKGKPGSKFVLGISPVLDSNSVRQVDIIRRNIDIPAVSWSGIIGGNTKGDIGSVGGIGNIGYIRLESFTQNCADAVRLELERLLSISKDNGVPLKGVVLDLRANGGGLVDQAVKICGLFVPWGTLITQIKGKVRQYDSQHRTQNSPIAVDLPLAVLVNGSSASASEIVAGALQDLDRAVIIGQRSFGKGLVQVTRPMGYNSFIKLTTAKYYIPSGRSIQARNYGTHNRAVDSLGVTADSLIHQYRTAIGRAVYDGAGINPDVILVPEYLSKFTAILYAYGYIEDFANLYAVRHPIAVDSSFNDSVVGKKGSKNGGKRGIGGTRSMDFSVSDSLYEEFVTYMVDKPIEFTSGTELKVKELAAIATQEKYGDRIDGELKSIIEKIKDDKSRDLRTFASEIRNLLTEVIINRWYYAGGRIEYSVRTDKEIAHAVEILRDSEQYNYILTKQDTSKK